MINNKYKDLYCNAHVYFLLKSLNIIIKSDNVITTDNIRVCIKDINNEFVLERDCAYCPSVFDIFEYVWTNYQLNIHINKHNNNWEWIVTDKSNNPIIYSGETEVMNAGYNIGKNIDENRKYYESELDAIEEAICEILLLI